jgi:hypothetical protein
VKGSESRLTEEGSAKTPVLAKRQTGTGRKARSTQTEVRADAHEHLDDEVERDDVDALEAISDDDRFEMFRESIHQSVLPDLPPMPGFHICWLTTSNPRDPISRRLQMGYTLICASDLGGDWGATSVKTGDYAGCVGINELVAAKIPLRLYQRYMREVHHDTPLADEEKLRANVEMMKDRAQAMGARLDEGDGMTGLVNRAPAPVFAG